MGLTTVVKPDTMPHLLVVPHLHQIGPSHIFLSFPKRAFTGTVLDITVNKRMEREKIKRDTTSSTTSIGEPERLALSAATPRSRKRRSVASRGARLSLGRSTGIRADKLGKER
jgi:hypothetical protein